MNKVDILFQHEEMIHKNIRLADQKATVLLTTNAALLFALIQIRPDDLNDCWTFLFYAGCLLLLSTIVMSFWVIKPRGKNITAFSTLPDPSENFEGDYEALLLGRIDHSIEINNNKYKWLRRVVPISMISWALTYSGMLIYSVL